MRVFVVNEGARKMDDMTCCSSRNRSTEHLDIQIIHSKWKILHKLAYFGVRTTHQSMMKLISTMLKGKPFLVNLAMNGPTNVLRAE